MFSITVYLKSGATIDFTCEEFEITRSTMTGEFTGYRIKRFGGKQVSFNVREIAAYTSEEVTE